MADDEFLSSIVGGGVGGCGSQSRLRLIRSSRNAREDL